MRSLILFLGSVVAIVVVIGVIAYVAATGQEGAPLDETQTFPSTPTTPNYTIEADPYTIEDIMPPLNRQVVFSDSVPESVKVTIRAKVAAIQKRLAEDPLRADDWYDLAVWYHTGSDYEGAREVWKFLTNSIPNDTTAYDNLGKLYHFTLKDYPKSEEYFLKSIQIAPYSPVPYLELFQLYAYSYKKDTNAAVDILIKAIELFPTNSDPLTLLGGY